MMRALLMTLLLLAGCPTAGSDDDDSSVASDDDDTTDGTGTLAISFRIDADWADAMDEPAIGPFRASIYLTDEVSGIGPDEGAEALADIFVDEVDLTGEDLSTGVLHVTGALPATWVTVLGFLDSDGNSVEPHGPDDGDPVTLPNSNAFEVLPGAETSAEVLFDFLNP